MKKSRFSKDPTYVRLIHTPRWQHLRLWILRERPVCEQCESEGYITAAVEVHHIRPVESVPGDADKERLMFDESNLMALCRRCHREIHRQMGKGTGAELRARTRKEAESAINRLFGVLPDSIEKGKGATPGG